ncbi:DsbA family oxidoreductase [Brachybacterium sp. AOP25-B2-12]|uniref:DsbA family oxidoreductase n=1 Tax=Brachybacterium sp. AOP25-B2-12 TaxID=3457710 RepID=UPI0040332731
MKVEIWSDIACPWCYVGTARFEQALARFAHRDQVEVIHRSFELNPGHPLDQTEPLLEFFQTRHGVGPGQARAQEQRIQQLAEAEALPFSLERHAGNTRRAHELVHLGAAEGIDVIGPVFRTYFSAEGTIFTIDGLVDIARHAGIDPERARTALEDGTFTDAVRADEAAAQPLGITGVPFFVLDETYAISGGQSTETFLSGLEQAWSAAHPLQHVAPAAGTCIDDGACEIDPATARA